MLEIKVNREKDDLIKFMKTKSEKIGLLCRFEDDKFTVEATPGMDSKSQTPIPVNFRGKLLESDKETTIQGKFSYGFYLSNLVIVAEVLIIARMAWSVYQKQLDNIILCLIVIVLLAVVCMVARMKGKELKAKIKSYLENLDKK